MKDKTVISISPAKNLQEVVYHNIDADGKKSSITRFEPLRSDRPQYRRAIKKNGGAQ